jgi:hypothetical protein
MSEGKATDALVTEPVLAQIQDGAPGRAFWIGVGALIWVLWFGLLELLSRRIAPRSSSPQPGALFFLGAALAFAGPSLLQRWMQVVLMRRLGAPARLYRRRTRPWRSGGFPLAGHVPAAERPLPRRAAIVVLLLPQLALVLVGLIALALGWFWAPFFVATAVSSSTRERALAMRLRREPGCTSVHFRRDGVVLYGTGRDFRPPAAVSLWVTSLVTSAGWMLAALLSGPGLIEAVANAALALRSQRAVIPYRYGPRWLTLRSRHQIWVAGPRLRIEVTSVPPEARNFPEWPTPRAADVWVTDPESGMLTVSDGHALISGPQGLFLLRRGSREVVRLKAGPLQPSPLEPGAIRSLPDVDPARLAAWRPGRVGAARLGRYRTAIYETDTQSSTGHFSTRLWVSPDLPVPVRIEEKFPHEERDETLRSVRFDLPLPGPLFRLPAGAVVRDLNRP